MLRLGHLTVVKGNISADIRNCFLGSEESKGFWVLQYIKAEQDESDAQCFGEVE